MRDETIAKRITINGLPIKNDRNSFSRFSLPDLDQYYRGCLIGGPAHFWSSPGFPGFRARHPQNSRAGNCRASAGAAVAVYSRAANTFATIAPLAEQLHLREGLRYRRALAQWLLGRRSVSCKTPPAMLFICPGSARVVRVSFGSAHRAIRRRHGRSAV